MDDMAVASPWCSGKIHQFTLKLGDHFEITELGKLRHILGLVITQNRSEKTIHISQTVYIYKMLVCFGIEGATPVSTPPAVKYDLSTVQSLVTNDKKTKYLNYAGDLYYLSIVGSLLFATQSRPDIQHAISLVSQFGSNPGILHLEAAKQIFCYLKGTMEHSLMLGHHSAEGFDLVD